jgi:hypothetical protein
MCILTDLCAARRHLVSYERFVGPFGALTGLENEVARCNKIEGNFHMSKGVAPPNFMFALDTDCVYGEQSRQMSHYAERDFHVESGAHYAHGVGSVCKHGITSL